MVALKRYVQRHGLHPRKNWLLPLYVCLVCWAALYQRFFVGRRMRRAFISAALQPRVTFFQTE